jgi:hypothetical protein
MVQQQLVNASNEKKAKKKKTKKKAKKKAKKEAEIVEAKKNQKAVRKAERAARTIAQKRDREPEEAKDEWQLGPRGRPIKDVSPKKHRKNAHARVQYGFAQQQLVSEQRIAQLEVPPPPPPSTHTHNSAVTFVWYRIV